MSIPWVTSRSTCWGLLAASARDWTPKSGTSSTESSNVMLHHRSLVIMVCVFSPGSFFFAALPNRGRHASLFPKLTIDVVFLDNDRPTNKQFQPCQAIKYG